MSDPNLSAFIWSVADLFRGDYKQSEVLALYKRLCRHLWDLDPTRAAAYVHAYRELWDSEERSATEPGAHGVLP